MSKRYVPAGKYVNCRNVI